MSPPQIKSLTRVAIFLISFFLKCNFFFHFIVCTELSLNIFFAKSVHYFSSQITFVSRVNFLHDDGGEWERENGSCKYNSIIEQLHSMMNMRLSPTQLVVIYWKPFWETKLIFHLIKRYVLSSLSDQTPTQLVAKNKSP